jgi:hypothetical protein
MIRTKPSTKEYRDNYDRVFRSGPPLYVDFLDPLQPLEINFVKESKKHQWETTVGNDEAFKKGISGVLDKDVGVVYFKSVVVNPDPIKLEETGKTLIIKTLDGDISLG